MKNTVKGTIALATVAAIAGVTTTPSIVAAWSDNGGGRPSYTEAEINKLQADGKWGNKIVFNSISDNPIGNEKNFVAARPCTQANCGGANANTVWNANEIEVEDGKTYIVRMYVHNNNPNGYNGVAKDTTVKFSVPNTSAKSIDVSGHISSSNATPSAYEDDVVFKSNTPFHLEYVYGSALLENQKVAKGGLALSDEIVNAKTGGVLIGYDALDGNIPGCYSYDGFVAIQVKAVYDYDFTVEKKVRIVGDADRTWKETVDAKVGDKVEFLIEYKNTSDKDQAHVTIKDTLPKNLRYVAGSTIIKNAGHPNGAKVNEDHIVGDGLRIGTYGPGANAYLKFTAEVIDNSLGCGHNALINWAQAGVGDTTRRDSASVTLTKACENKPETPTTTDGETPTALPTTGPEAIAGGIIAVGATATAAGYYIVSRRQLR